MNLPCIKCPALVECRTQIVYATACRPGGLLVVGEAPGKDEDISGEGFMGIAGKTLDRLLAVHNIQRNDYGRANICRCRPPLNRKPNITEINACLPFLAQLIQNTQPKVILTIGGTPTTIFCGKGALYPKIMQFRTGQSFLVSAAHPEIRAALAYVRHIVPAPHTSPLAFNRNCPSGEKWGEITAQQIALAVELLAH